MNGLSGKTVVRPAHATAVNALSTVAHNEYCDVLAIVTTRDRPGHAPDREHRAAEGASLSGWADRILNRASSFGVLRPEVGFADVMRASDRMAG